AFVSATPSKGTYDGTTGVWAVGSVTAGTPETLAIRARVASSSALMNVAGIAHADQFDPNPGNNAAGVTTTPPGADLPVTKAVSDPTPNVGDTITYTITLANNGPDAATGVTVQDALPACLAFVSAAPGQGAYDPATGLWTV